MNKDILDNLKGIVFIVVLFFVMMTLFNAWTKFGVMG